MEIEWYGHSFFRIKSKGVRVAIDPFSEKIGLKPPKVEADILLISHNHYDHNNKDAVSGDYFLIESEGEYEVKGVFVFGIESFHDQSLGKERGKNIIYKIEFEGWKICHLGDFGQKELTLEQKERIGEVEILMIPVGGIYTISAQEAVRIIQELEPKIVIPMHYFLPQLNIPLDPVEKFLKAMGIKSAKTLDSLKLKKEEKLPGTTEVFVLKPK